MNGSKNAARRKKSEIPCPGNVGLLKELGFVVTFGAEEANYLILKNGESTLELFFRMFDTNILTFNPGSGWNGLRPTPMSATPRAALTKPVWI